MGIRVTGTVGDGYEYLSPCSSLPLTDCMTMMCAAALRLLRKCIGLKDEFYYRHITRLDLFRPVVDAFVANAHKYNLLNSALIELFDFIRVVSFR